MIEPAKDEAAYSRTALAASRLAEHAEDHSKFVDKRVLLTGDRRILETGNGQECFLDSLLLLPRICRSISFALPPGLESLEEECRARLRRIEFQNEFAFVPCETDLSKFDAILSVGAKARPELPWTVINSNGWVVRVSSGAKSLSPDCGQNNAVGALAAASLGVTEVFKRLIKLRETRGILLDGFVFSLYSYESGADDPGPGLPERLRLALLLAGIGAIGNGVVHLLRQIGAQGEIDLVDREDYTVENLGTCLLIGPAQVGASKVRFAADWLRGPMRVMAWPEEISRFRSRFPAELRYPKVVVNCLDNIEARHEIQDLWPDVVIDGAIGDFPSQVSVHPWGEDVACLRCLFKHSASASAEQAAARATGLGVDRVQQTLDVLTDSDVEKASPEKQRWLRGQVGKQICSVVQDAVAQEISREQQSKGFQPSAPFVASFSASMVVAELVKYVSGQRTILEPRFQCDLLWGPHRGLSLPEARHEDCICVTRSKNITRARSARQTRETDRYALRDLSSDPLPRPA